MYEQIAYSKPLVKEAIIRIDLASQIESINKKLSNKLYKNILNFFPIAEPQKSYQQQFEFTGKSIQGKGGIENTEWVFFTKSRDHQFTINKSCINIISAKYSTYENFSKSLKSIIIDFFDQYNDSTAIRIGVRYINILSLENDSSNPLDWSEYIEPNMIGITNYNLNKEYITRALNILEFNFDGENVKLQFGVSNSDFPAPVKKKEFVIDIDCYNNGIFEYNDIINIIDNSHNRVQDFFEKTITNKTRELIK